MKVRYSVEAFALAMILFTTGLEAALVVGAIVVAGTVLGDTLADKTGKTAAAAVAGIVTYAALTGAMLYTGMASLSKASVEYVNAALVALLVVKHVCDGVEEASTGEILKQNYVALLVMAVVAVIRELLGSGALFGYEVAGELAVVSSTYLKNYFGLIFAGLGIAAVNTMLKKEPAGDSLYVAVAVVICAVLSMILGKSSVDAAAVLKSAISGAIAVVLLISVRGKMLFSTPGKHFAGFPVEVIAYGFLTMMLTVIA